MNRAALVALSLAGIAAWLAFMIATAPASLVTALFDDIPEASLTEPRGSLWRGSATLHANRATLGTLSWSVSGWARLTLELRGADIALDARLRHRPLRGRTEIHDIRGSVPLSTLAVLTGIERVFEAEVVLERAMVELAGPEPVALDGTVSLRAMTALHPRRTPLGDYRLALSREDGWMVARVVDAEGALGASGEFALTAAGDWRMDLRLHATDPGGEIAEALAFIGEPAPDGSYRVEFSGRL